MSIVKLGKLSTVDALIALFNNAKPQGYGYFWYIHDRELSKEEAKSFLDKYEYIDYLEGRVIKIKFTKNATELDCTLYDRDNGEGSAERAIREYERIHYLHIIRAQSLYVPETFGGSKCIVAKDVGYGNIYKFNLMGGELSLYQFKDFESEKLQTIFTFSLNKTVSSTVVKDTDVDRNKFIECARKVIKDIVEQLK